jgi:GntR family transcriptional regulator
MTRHSAQLFSIAPGSTEPIYRQLVEQARRQVAGGQLAPGDGMPSVRELAQALAVNPMTVSKAYGLLEMEGLLVRRRGVGMAVAAMPARASSVKARTALLQPILARAATEARQLELDPDTVLALFSTLLKEAR